MDIEALLCDAATVRENLLHILGGGLGQLWRDAYPAPLGIDLALLLTLHPSETTDEHELRILIQDTDGKQIAQVDATFSIGPQAILVPPGQMVRAPIAINLRTIPIPAPGLYSFELLVDKQHRRSLPFQAMPAGEQPPTQVLMLGQ
jgi:hypothetical protein